MVEATSDIQKGLALMRREYAQKLPERVSEIEKRWAELLQEPWNHESLQNLQLKVHGLVGSGATFGIKSVSKAARPLETLLQSLIDNTDPPTEEQRIHISRLIGSLKEAVPQSLEDDLELARLS